jgi:hypothetical protein
MKIGDLVQYKNERWASLVGVILRQVPGTDEIQIVRWLNHNCYPEGGYAKRNLEVISESR